MSGLLANYRNECAKLMSSKKYIVSSKITNNYINNNIS